MPTEIKYQQISFQVLCEFKERFQVLSKDFKFRVKSFDILVRFSSLYSNETPKSSLNLYKIPALTVDTVLNVEIETLSANFSKVPLTCS